MKKVFFIVSHLRAGGSEKVFWILSQYFDQSKFEVYLLVLDLTEAFYSPNLKGVKIIDLNSPRASTAIFKIIRLIKIEKPYAVFTTGGHINTLLAIVSLFVSIPKLIGRESNVMNIMNELGGFKEKFWDKFMRFTYNRFDIAICQWEIEGFSSNNLVTWKNEVDLYREIYFQSKLKKLIFKTIRKILNYF
jgi:UDP-N-acetylglucosamine:LPS N-acetylglucosamine transferase